MPVSEELSKAERLNKKDLILGDEKGLALTVDLGKRVAEITRVMRAGVSALAEELPDDYFYTSDELYCR